MDIGMKAVSIEVFQEVSKFPEITFIADAAVPNLNGILDIASFLPILNFTYTFPAILYVGFQIQLGAMLLGEGFDPHMGVTIRYDTGMKSWVCLLWNGFLGGY
ncbi:hypothetical protein F5882DRAFT_461989 [Hyaloscypha sp. PMI_1271]|nr:hypothetical protein F5882DRAFT_461989 [Hyaloscypha sp. PMI_1271]